MVSTCKAHTKWMRPLAVGLLACTIAVSWCDTRAASVPFVFTPGAVPGSWVANVPFPQDPVLNDPRGYAVDVTGLLSTVVSYPCGPGPCPSGSYTVFADISISYPTGFPFLPPPPLAVRVFGYGDTIAGPQLYPFDARFVLTPEQAGYFQGSGEVQVPLLANLDRTADSFFSRDIFYDQSIVDAQFTLSPTPLPSSMWLFIAGLASLLGFMKRRASVHTLAER